MFFCVPLMRFSSELKSTPKKCAGSFNRRSIPLLVIFESANFPPLRYEGFECVGHVAGPFADVEDTHIGGQRLQQFHGQDIDATEISDEKILLRILGEDRQDRRLIVKPKSDHATLPLPEMKSTILGSVSGGMRESDWESESEG